MKKFIGCCVVSCLIVVCAARSVEVARDDSSSGAARPDLSGTWEMDKQKSSAGGSKTATLSDAVTLVVEHREPSVKVTRKAVVGGQVTTAELVYYTDGRGETNPSPLGGGEAIESKTKWEGRKLVTRFTQRMRMRSDVVSIDYAEKWELSKDGKRLTQATSFSAPRGITSPSIFVAGDMSNIKRVYNRAP